jgi:hypothetical protein
MTATTTPGAREILASADRDAAMSECGRFRYRLSRVWAPGPQLLFVMLNPSTADAEVDDATIRRCVTFANLAGFSGLQVVNLFAFRATKPADLRAAGWPVGPDNDSHIAAAACAAAAVCVAWGAIGERGPASDRVQEVMPRLWRAGHEPQCLSITRSGYPQHPLYLPSTCRLRPYDLRSIEAATAGCQ